MNPATARVTGFAASIAKKEQLDSPVELKKAFKDYTITNELLKHRIDDGKELKTYD